MSVRAAARQLKISHAAVARYFPNRRALLTDMATASLRELTGRVDEARETSAPGTERWRAVGAAAADYATRRPHRYALCWRFDEMQVDDERWLEAGANLTARLRPMLSLGRYDAADSLVAAGSLLNGYVILRDCGALAVRNSLRA